MRLLLFILGCLIGAFIVGKALIFCYNYYIAWYNAKKLASESEIRILDSSTAPDSSTAVDSSQITDCLDVIFDERYDDGVPFVEKK